MTKKCKGCEATKRYDGAFKDLSHVEQLKIIDEALYDLDFIKSILGVVEEEKLLGSKMEKKYFYRLQGCLNFAKGLGVVMQSTIKTASENPIEFQEFNEI